MGELNLCIPGTPIAKQRPRFVRRGPFVKTFNPQETEEGRWLWELQRQLPADWRPLEGPVYLSMDFVMPVPASTSKKRRTLMECGQVFHTKRPDIDNCGKWVMDCCNGVLWHDDCQVTRIAAVKRYGTEPHTRILLASAERKP